MAIHNKVGSTSLAKRSAVAAAVCLMVATGAVYAQSSTGTINGRAAKGDVVLVEAKSIGITRQVKLDSDGNFQVGQLPAGSYNVTVTRANGTKETVTVVVQSGEGSTVAFGQQLERVEIIGTGIKTLDVKSTESAQTLNKAQLDRIPIPKDVTSIALLAPGATVSDNRLGYVPSLGGASPAENAYYINGFNVTNIVNGLAFNQVPDEAVAEQQVKTGGYGAEYGRSLGGVISVNTKRGTNEWQGGANINMRNSSWDGASLYAERDPVTAEWLVKTRPGGVSSTTVNAWVGGPIIKDKLFIFGLVKSTRSTTNTYSANTQTEDVATTPQYLVKLDWNVTDSNLFELTAFSDKRKTNTKTWLSTKPYDKARGDYKGPSSDTSGGANVIAKWTSWLTSDLSISALAGAGKYDRSNQAAGADCPVVIDLRTPTRKDLGCWTATRIGEPKANDERKAFRLDAEWVLGKHTVKVGLDRETYTVLDGTATSGDGQYVLRTRQPGQKLANGFVIPGVAGVDPAIELVEYRMFKNGGAFKTINSAFYVEDNFQVTKTLLASVGVRSESFTNKNAKGVPFIDVKNTIAPRFGASWDVNGNSDLKVFGNAGRYFIPVYANTNVRLSGSETDYRDFFMYGGSLSSDRLQKPALGAQLGSRLITSDGKTPNPLSVVDTNIKPMFQDEFIVGFQKALKNKWTVGMKYTHRKLGSGMDDVCNDEGPTLWAEGAGYTKAQAAAIGAAIGHCFLYNPGSDLTANIDINGDGTLKEVKIPAAAMAMPKAKRTYDALELTFERPWDKKWSLQGSYVLSYSKGNAEGYVKSDIGQDDAGISQDFDYPGLMEGSEGYLPNDRRHSFKIFGSFAATDEWRLGAVVQVQSGRPKNCFGVYAGTLDGVSAAYGDASFYCNGKLMPRGSLGRHPWTKQLNLQATYTPNWMKGFTFSADLINVLNERNVLSMEEGESSGMSDPKSGYGRPLGYQPARSLRLKAQYEF